MIYYQTYGESSNDVLVLLHSGGMAGIEWQPQINILAKYFRLLVPDLPGHGQSRLAAGQQLSVAMMAEAVLSLLVQEKLAKAHFLGSSMGAATALWLAINYPQYVDKLVVYRMGYAKNQATYEQTLAMADPAYWQQYGLHKWLSKIHTPQGDADSWKQVIANVAKIMHPQNSDHNHALSALVNLAAPTLLIAGDRDPLIPLHDLVDMYNTIPTAALWIMPNASHVTASNTWRATAFAEEVRRFLRTAY